MLTAERWVQVLASAERANVYMCDLWSSQK